VLSNKPAVTAELAAGIILVCCCCCVERVGAKQLNSACARASSAHKKRIDPNICLRFIAFSFGGRAAKVGFFEILRLWDRRATHSAPAPHKRTRAIYSSAELGNLRDVSAERIAQLCSGLYRCVQLSLPRRFLQCKIAAKTHNRCGSFIERWSNIEDVHQRFTKLQ
jgi:hypothetical protein